MEQMSYKELDDRIHSFLTRKFAELATLERIPRASAWRPKAPTTRKMAQHWGGA